MDKKVEQAIQKSFDRLSRNAIALSYAPSENETKNTQSKIGGKPWLPKGFQWPYYEGKSYQNVVANRPLAFLAEVHLSEVALFDTDGLLPRVGVLSFFYEMETEKCGLDPKDKGCAKVFYFEDKSVLYEHEFPEDLHVDYQFPEFSLSFKREISLPSYSDFYETPQGREQLEPVSRETNASYWEDYEKLKEQYGCRTDEWAENSKLLGTQM